MATTKIPSNKGIRQLNLNDTAGEFWSSRNIDLHTNPNKIKLARPMRQIADDTDLDGELPMAILVYSDDVHILTNDVLYRFNSDLTQLITETTSPSSADDGVIFDGQIVISDNQDVDAWDGNSYTTSWWTARGNPSLTRGNHHLMEVVRIGAETLVVADGSSVHAYTGGIASGAVSSVTLDLAGSFKVTCIKHSIRKIFIGTYSEDLDQAYVFEWDGASTNYTQAFPVGAKAVLSMEIVDNVPVIITERGEIKMFNNAGFTTVSQLPFTTKPVFDESVTTGLIQPNPQARAVHSKGMKRFGNTLFIYTNFIDIDNDFPLDERSPNGIWVFNLKTYSLNHVSSLNNEVVYGQVTPLEYVNSENGRLYAGLLSSDTTHTGRTMWCEDLTLDAENEGYFVTSEIESDTVTDLYNEVVTKFKLDDSDEIKVKYRTTSVVDYPVKVSGTWSETNVFNTTEDLSVVKARFDLGERDELEVITKVGDRIVGQITSIEKSASTYQVTIDSSCGIIDEDSKVQFDNWKLIPETLTSSDGNYRRLGIGEAGTYGHFKVVIKGKNGYPEIRQFIVKSNAKEEL